MNRRAGVILLNSLSTYLRMGLGMVLSLLITRTTLQILAETSPTAKEVFGIFMLLTSITTTCQFLNDSTNKAMVRFLSISLHNDDREQSQRWLNNGWLISTAMGTAIAITMAALAPWLVASFNVPEALVVPARQVVWFSAIAQVIAAATQPWYSIMGAEDRYTLINILNVLQQVLTFAGLYVLKFLPFNIMVNLTLVWIVPSVAMGAFLAVWLWLRKPFMRLHWRYFHWQDCRQLFSLGGWSSLISFASSLYERTDQILINLLIGPTANAAYAVVIQLGSAVNRLVTSLTAVLLPTASRIVATGSPWEKQQLILRSTRYVLILAMPCAAGLSIFRREVIELWLGQGFEEAITVLPFTMLLVFSRIPVFVTWPYLTAANQLKLPALAMLFDGIVNVVLSILYVKAFNLGLTGIVLGTLSTNMIRFACFQIPFVAKLIEIPLLQYWQEGYGRPLLSMLWLVPALWLIHLFSLSTLLTSCLLLLAVSAYILWTWFQIFDDYERKLLPDMLNHSLKKKKKTQNQ